MAGRDDVTVLDEYVRTPPDVSSVADEVVALDRRRGVSRDDYLRSNYEFEMQLCERVSTTVSFSFLVDRLLTYSCAPSQCYASVSK